MTSPMAPQPDSGPSPSYRLCLEWRKQGTATLTRYTGYLELHPDCRYLVLALQALMSDVTDGYPTVATLCAVTGLTDHEVRSLAEALTSAGVVEIVGGLS